MTGRALTPLFLLAIAACASPAALSSASVAPAFSALNAPPPPAPAAASANTPAVDASPYAMTITLGATAITSSGATILPLAPRDELARHGADAQFKRLGENDLFILPLAAAAAQARAADKAAHPAESSTALVVVEPSTPYRIFIEVLFTLGQNEFGTFDLLMTGEKRIPRRTTPPRAASAKVSAGARSLNATIFITSGGFSVKAMGGNLAPGCADVGAGVAVPTTAAGYDHDGLVRCMVRVKGAIPELAAETRVTLAANPGVDFATVAAVMDELRMHDGADLFPEVQFGIAR